MERSYEQILSEAIAAAKEDFRDIYLHEKPRLDNLQNWRPLDLIAYEKMFEFHCVDGILRLIGIQDSSKLNWRSLERIGDVDEKKVSWWATYYRGEEILKQLNFEMVVRLYWRTNDLVAVRMVMLAYLPSA